MNPPTPLLLFWGSSWGSRPGASRQEEPAPGVAVCWPACTRVALVWGCRSPCPPHPEGEPSPAWPWGRRRPGGEQGWVRPGQGPDLVSLSSGAGGWRGHPLGREVSTGWSSSAVSDLGLRYRPGTGGAFAFDSISCQCWKGQGAGEGTESVHTAGAPLMAGIGTRSQAPPCCLATEDQVLSGGQCISPVDTWTVNF